MEISKENICINQMVSQKRENIIAEADFIIPDVKPDILNVINTNGNICIYKKEITDGKVRIEGGIDVYIMYLADNDISNVRGINSTLDFSYNVNIENARSGMNIENKTYLKQIECKIINGRKLNVKAILDNEIKIFSDDKIEFINQVENIKNLQMLNEEIQINSLLGKGKTRVYAKDTIMIDNTDKLSDIMKCNVNLVDKETKTSYNKVLAKADTNINILYLTDDNRLNEVKAKIPIMGFVDMQNVSDNNICDTNYEIKNIIIKPNPVDEHSIYIEVEVEISCNAYENKKIDLIQDLYCTNEEIKINSRQIQLIQDKKSFNNILNIRENQKIEELQGHKLYDVEVRPTISKETKLNDKIIYDGEIELKLLFASNNSSGIDIKLIKIPFSNSIDLSGIPQNPIINTELEILANDFIILPDDILEIKIDILFKSDMYNNSNINIIEGILVDKLEQEDPYSIVVYFVKSGDSLWKIAKKFKSTVKDIAAVNDIADVNKISIGQQLFIPR